jgi:uncharacterized protein YjbI with pentapeptide repeats
MAGKIKRLPKTKLKKMIFFWLWKILKSKHFWTALVSVIVLIVIWLNFNLLAELVVHEKLKDLMLDYWVLIFTFWVIILTLVIWLVPIWQVKSLKGKKGGQDQSEFELEKERIKLRDDTRKTIAQIIGGAFLLLGLFATYNTFELNRQGQELSREGQVTERFSKAVALLDSEDISVRVGGLYALERIAKDSPKDHSTIMEILAAFIREKSKEQKEQFNKAKFINPKPENIAAITTSPTDVKAAIIIIGRRNVENDKEDFVFNLSNSNLSDANLKGAILIGADLSFVNFSNANLVGANLEGANLFKANLASVNFSGANLSFVSFIGASPSDGNFSGANLSFARLDSANLKSSKFSFTNLSNASLFEVDLSGADLSSSNLSNANLFEANLSGADLFDSSTVSFEQLSTTVINSQTRLPKNLESRRAELLKLSEKNLEKRLEKEAIKTKFNKPLKR